MAREFGMGRREDAGEKRLFTRTPQHIGLSLPPPHNGRSVYSVARGNAPENTVSPGPFARAKSKRSAALSDGVFGSFSVFHVFRTSAIVRPPILLLLNRPVPDGYRILAKKQKN